MSRQYHTALLTISLFIPEAHSLKDRRSVVHSVKERIRNKFNVSVIESKDNNLWQRATLYIAGLGSDSRNLNREFDHIIEFVEKQILGRAQILDCQMELD